MALKLSRYCKMTYSYGICERCNRCGYITRIVKYNNLKDYSKQLYINSKKSVEETENAIESISNLELSCKEILKMLKDKVEYDGNMVRLSYKVKILSKIGKKLCKILKRFMKKVEEIQKLSQSIENKID